ncbi:MAG: hypothetical protein WC346_15425 [Methanogenium sp.]|jgi:hypothetical protein
MEHRSLVYKYWVSFDNDGEIKTFYKSKYDAKEPCKEYVVKLLPIERDTTEEINNAVDAVEKESRKLVKSLSQVDTEFKKTIRGLKGILR